MRGIDLSVSRFFTIAFGLCIVLCALFLLIDSFGGFFAVAIMSPLIAFFGIGMLIIGWNQNDEEEKQIKFRKKWLLTITTILILLFLGYIVYEAMNFEFR
ncbi:hypothetical protein NBRC116583_36130 [Arenicella sp. 4NH20-0111]|uniref:hypothetical protein n=1 Tax=Arenicella sp. 4NH20-0111 TaxID=3127648 RepID=UPI003103D466